MTGRRECWRPVSDWEGRYEVSDQGRVRSLLYPGRPGALRSLAVNSRGYLQVTLYRGNKGYPRTVHTLVAQAFHGTPAAGQEVRHLNGDPLDARAGNLAWGSPTENCADIKRHGRNWQLNKDRCPQDHRYDDVNTDVRVHRGAISRRCRECHRERERARYARRQGAA